MEHIKDWRSILASNPLSMSFYNACTPQASIDLRQVAPVSPMQFESVNNQVVSTFRFTPVIPTVWAKERVSLNATYAQFYGGGNV